MRNEPPEIFIDSNVWFSYLWGSKNCEILIKAHVDSQIRAVISRQVLEEIFRNLRFKLPQTIPTLESLVVASPPKVLPDPVSIEKLVKKYVDSIDQRIFQAAVNANMKYFVTGNIRDFNGKKLHSKTGIQILTPAQAVEAFKLRD